MKTYFTSVLLLLTTCLFAQDPVDDKAEWREQFVEGNSLIVEKFYKEALDVWTKLYDLEPDNANVNYKIGLCLENIPNRKKEALKYFEKAASKTKDNYISDFEFEKSAPKAAHYHLGRSYHLNGRFDDAIAQFDQFISSVNEKHVLIDDCERYKQWSVTAKQLMAKPLDIEIANIGGAINSEYADFSPVLTLDEGAIFFTSRRLRKDSTNYNIFFEDGQYYEDIYVSYKDDQGAWSEPEELNFNTREHEATISVAPGGQLLYIYKADEIDGGDIYFSESLGKEWSAPVKMGSDINTKYWETHITSSTDGNTLYFVSDRPEGLGGRDIYRCVKLPNGEWSKALNVGPPINTPYDEDSPFLSPDGRTLYFSSNGHKTMGGFDVFKSMKIEDETQEKWADPINIGYPINTLDDDIFFTMSASGQTGYYSSAIETGQHFGEKDIYEIQFNEGESFITVLKGKVKVPHGCKLPDNTIIYVTDVETGETKTFTPRSRDGVFVMALDPCKQYELEYAVDGQTTVFKETIEVPCESSYQEINKELALNHLNIDCEGKLIGDGSDQFKYQILVGDQPLNADGAIVTYFDTDKEKTFAEAVQKDGYFNYNELKPELMTIFDLQAPANVACDKVVIRLVDKAGKELSRSERIKDCRYKMKPVQMDSKKEDGPMVHYERYFKYNMKDFKISEKEYQAFIKKVVGIVKKNGKVDIIINGSASKVPTRTFKSNDELSLHRSNGAKDNLLKALEKNGISADKVNFVAIDSRVQGPDYKMDYMENKNTYEKYQYIKIDAK